MIFLAQVFSKKGMHVIFQNFYDLAFDVKY